MAKIRPATIASFYEALNPSGCPSRQASILSWKQERRSTGFCAIVGFPPTSRTQILSSSIRPRRSGYDTRTFSTSSRVSDFTYRLAASFNAKDTRYNPKSDHFSFDPAVQSSPSTKSPNQRPNSGQDAFFICKVGIKAEVAFAVADGVGGWSDSGIDSAHFSRGICEYMKDWPRESWSAKFAGPRELLEHGYEEAIADHSIEGGGSTACVATGRSDGTLEVANLGDSGFIQLRLNAVHFHSTPQTHAFNTPYQLSIVPPKMLARSKMFGGRPLSDFPRDSNVTTHKVRHGDVLVFATDGVWDNLSSADILKIVSRKMTESKAWISTERGMKASQNLRSVTKPVNASESENTDLQSILAIRITDEAKMASMNMKRDGPFAKEVQKYYPGEDFHGGKVDDICVIVAIVVET